MIFLDALRIKVRDGGRVVNKSAYMAIGVDVDGIKHILGLWIAKEKARPFGHRYAPTCPTVGSKTSSLSAVTSFKGLPEAGEATWLGSMVQTCVVHLIRAANRWVACGVRKGVFAALKKVYTTPDMAAENRRLCKENADLNHTNKILRTASAFFAATDPS
ncbi:hypothetical protein FRC0028_02068 [Corynebacterium diphtheriae]|uniref:transposase n=1 Tax=Corynebacterium diphtheriae TaxID=1717 RepID=UPI0013CA31B3|nr:hypothetical protein FRC0081_01477 [Corynebacterium diphtheriae]CAB0708315.1 hypothetical protein FRC0037_01874 [Corynebacterium diphtheriae]CAB0708548.1 hypothetical protein FRC0031_01876 [Corynebacterium diphtheriae]CAB0708894.1 hypothetical protein FRC0038_01883 [Corynebacterium diphtheriae]CAB0712230.1 hypothetical protein FRC0028_02068 [Corynebacterium diphtheriae]